MFGFIAALFGMGSATKGIIKKGESRYLAEHQSVGDTYVDPVNTYRTIHKASGHPVDTKIDRNGFITYYKQGTYDVIDRPTEREWRSLFDAFKIKSDITDKDLFCTLRQYNCELTNKNKDQSIAGGFGFCDRYYVDEDKQSMFEHMFFYRTIWGIDFFMDNKGMMVRLTDDQIEYYKKKTNKESGYSFNEYLIRPDEMDHLKERFNVRMREINESNINLERQAEKHNYVDRGRNSDTNDLIISSIINRYYCYAYMHHPRTVSNYLYNQTFVCREMLYQKPCFTNMEHYKMQFPNKLYPYDGSKLFNAFLKHPEYLRKKR